MTSALTLSGEELALVCEILREHLPRDVTVHVFGSRVKPGRVKPSRAKPWSDLDLVLEGPAPLPLSLIGTLAEAFEDSALPWKVDLIDRNTLTNAFGRLIDGSKIPLASSAAAVNGEKPRAQGWHESRHALTGTVMRIAIASDHAAFGLKAELRDHLIGLGHEVADLGPDTADRVDYPDYGYQLADVVADGTAELGVALCGSGIGMSIAVNRHPALRCALVSDPYSAALAREHNNANAIAMGARLIGPDQAKACLDAFLASSFAGGRHAARVDKLTHPTC